MVQQEQPGGKIAWWAIEWLREGHRHCEAPRHAGQRILSEWVMAVIPLDSEPVVQGMCQACMTMIASDLGTTPAEGAQRQ